MNKVMHYENHSDDPALCSSVYSDAALCLKFLDMEKGQELIIQYCDEAIRLNKCNLDAYLLKGLVYAHQGKEEQCVSIWKHAAELLPEADTWMVISYYGIEAGLFDFSLEALKKVQEYDPSYPDLNERLTLAYILLRDIDQAICYNQRSQNPLSQSTMDEIRRVLKENDKGNSIQILKDYLKSLGEPYNPIEISDIINIMSNITFVEEMNDIPFPQANTFNIVLDLLSELNAQDMSSDDITNFLEYNPRQTNYYIDAAKYLGFVTKDKNYTLTDYGRKIMRMNHKDRTLEIIKSILSHRPFYLAMKQQLENYAFNTDAIARSIDECRSEINKISTAKRRTSTVTAWIKWILDVTTYFDIIDL